MSKTWIRHREALVSDDKWAMIMAVDRFKRRYTVEIDFDTPFDFAEQDLLACVVLEKLVDEFWGDAAAGTQQGNIPVRVRATLAK